MHPRVRSSFVALTLAALAAACGGDSSTGPDSYQPTTLAQALAEIGSPAIVAGNAAFVDVGAPALDATRCPYSATSQSFVCTTLVSDGLTLDQSFTLLNASGGKQSAFDPATTASVRANTSLSGNYSDAGTTLAITGQQEVTVSGLTTGPHVLNGLSSFSLAGTLVDGGASIPLNIIVNTTITNLVIPANAVGSNVWPSSGKIVIDVSGNIAGVNNTQKTTITFNGTSTVDIVVTGFGAATCKVNLATSAPACP